MILKRGLTLGLIVSAIALGLSILILLTSGYSIKFGQKSDAIYTPNYNSTYTPNYNSTYAAGFDNYSYANDAVYSANYYDEAVKKSISDLESENEKIAIRLLWEDFTSKATVDILVLELGQDPCKNIDCRGANIETVKRYIHSFVEARSREDASTLTMRSISAAEKSAAAAQNGSWTTFVSAIIALFAFFVSASTLYLTHLRRMPKH